MVEIPKSNKGDMWGAVKWICIAIVAGLIATGLYKTYRIATEPARMVGAAAEKTTDVATAVLTRLDIKMPSQKRLNQAADAAFPILLNYPVTNSEDMRDSLFRRTNLLGTDGRVCRFDLDFGNGPQAVYTAIDHAAFETARAVGGLKDRKIRMVIRTPELPVSFNAVWDEDRWTARWRRTTIKKPIGDAAASARLMDVLAAIPVQCGETLSAE